jgi:hypothetical protein
VHQNLLSEIFGVRSIADASEGQPVDPHNVVLVYGFPVNVDRGVGLGEVVRIGAFDDAKVRQLDHGAGATKPGLSRGSTE